MLAIVNFYDNLHGLYEANNSTEELKMGKQYNKLQKRARRKAYLERVKAKVRASMKSGKKK